MEYTVVWLIPISAESPADAAREARKAQLDPKSLATVFDIHDHETGAAYRVDVDESGVCFTDQHTPDYAQTLSAFICAEE